MFCTINLSSCAFFFLFILSYPSSLLFYPNCAPQDALLDYRMDTPFVPEVKDPDHYSESDLDGDVEGFASDFL